MQTLMSGCELLQRRYFRCSSYFECWLLRMVFTWTYWAASWNLHKLLHPLCLDFLCKKKKRLYIKRNGISWQIKFLAAGMPFWNAYFVSSQYVICAGSFFLNFFFYFCLDIAIYCVLFRGGKVRLPATNCCAFSVLGIKIKDLITGPSNPCS